MNGIVPVKIFKFSEPAHRQLSSCRSRRNFADLIATITRLELHPQRPRRNKSGRVACRVQAAPPLPTLRAVAEREQEGWGRGGEATRAQQQKPWNRCRADELIPIYAAEPTSPSVSFHCSSHAKIAWLVLPSPACQVCNIF